MTMMRRTPATAGRPQRQNDFREVSADGRGTVLPGWLGPLKSRARTATAVRLRVPTSGPAHAPDSVVPYARGGGTSARLARSGLQTGGSAVGRAPPAPDPLGGSSSGDPSPRRTRGTPDIS